MNSDDLFSSSVWASTTPTETHPPADLPHVAEPASVMDEFDDFGEPAPAAADDFGDDFGDFGDAQESMSASAFDDADGFRTAEAPPAPAPSAWGAPWEPLSLDPFPPPHVLAARVEQLLDPIWPNAGDDDSMTDEPIRQAEGLNQTLVSPESRSLFQLLCPPQPPATRPPDWIRSRIRRQHLIALGIPINLDEVLPQANGKQMPALHITTRPASTPPGSLPRHQSPIAAKASSNHPSRAGTPQPQGSSRSGPPSAAGTLRLGPKPQVDNAKISELLLLEPDALKLLPLHVLEAHLSSLRNHTADASTLLAYLLQTKDALQQDSETYNGLIGELVNEAQKSKMAQRGRTGAKRSSAFS